MKRNFMQSKIVNTFVLLVFALLFSGTAWADNLTVHNGSETNGYVPVYGYYADAYLKCEFVYPASELSAMTGGTISAMKFYASESDVSWGSANFKVYLKETSGTTISSFDASDGTLVYDGSLSIVNGEMSVGFTSGFSYSGGNLLVGVYNTEEGDYVSSTWYGETVTGASVQGYDYSDLSSVSPTQQNFLPKVTFTYTPPTGPYLTLAPSSATVLTGFTQSLTAIYGNVSGTPTITYTSSNTSVATLSGSGTSVTVTGLAIGSATITASMTVNGTPYTATCAITVADPSYCEPYFSNPSDDYISSFVTTGGTSNISNSTGASTGGYGDYYSSYSASITAGETLSCTVTPNTNSYSYGHAIWVDWNKDGDFSDSGEKVDYTTSTATGIWTGYISVPAATPTGDYRIRVIHLYNGTPTDPCMSETYGEAEDYKLTVLSPTEPYILLSPSTATVLTGFSETLTATYGNAGTPTITYTSSDSNIASVSGSGTTATVTGVAAGFATITASMTVNGTPYTATCAITVEDPSYCTPSYSETSDYIKSFVTTGGTTNISNTNTSQGTGGYSDFYSSHSASITPGETLSFSVTRGYSDSYKYAIWVDWNHDYVFDVSTEVVASVTTSQSSDWSGSFNVPANTPVGDYRMRVEMLYGSSSTLDPCVSASYGEVEDYKLTVLSLSCPAPTGLIAGTPNTNSVQLSWTAGGSEQSWQICVNGDEGNLVSANSNPFNLTSLMQGTTYIVKVRAYCDENDQSTWSNSVTFTTEESCPKPTNVHAGNLTQHTAQITWNGNADSYNVQYATATVTGTTLEPVFFDDFENGFGNWTTYALGEYTGDTWALTNSTSLVDYYPSGSYGALTRSYYNGVDVSVDNWLVSPQMTLGDVLKFWVVGDNNNYQEYYAVYVSTNTNATGDFVFVEAPELAPGDGTWAERTVDLSAYAGQQGYIAIRHTDFAQDFLILDDFGVYKTVNSYSYGPFTSLPPTTETSCNITGLSSETLYVAQVQSDCDGDGTSGWSSVYFTTPDACSAPTDLVASNITATTATLGWSDNQDSYNVQYRKVYFFESFEGENLPTGWTTIDANSDGNCWTIGHATTHSGNNGAANFSYIYGESGTTPDDFLVSPLLDLQGTLRVWLSGITAYTYEEYFSIYVSTTGNTVSDFTSTTPVCSGTTTNQYVECTADLSSYAGQQGYIAIRHHNCSDQRYLYVDDFGLYGSENWVSVSPNPTDATASLSGLSAGTDYEWQVQGISCNNNGDNTSWSATSNFTTLYPTKIRNTSPAADEMTWLQFAKFVSKGHSYSDETVTLMENISASDMVGTNSHSFCGTFDGDGKTITANISSSEQGAAPFRYISGATIQNLVVAGTVTSTAHHASGLVGFCADGSSNTIQNCLVSTNVTNSNAYNGDSGNNYMGGIIGHNMTATTSIIGCVYDGTLTSQGFKGGIIGFAGNNSTINLTNSYFGGGYSANGYTDPNFSPIGVKSSGRTENINFSNFYYNTEAGTFTASGYNIMNGTNNVTGSPKLSYTVTGATDVTVAMRGDYTHYDVSDIYGYGTGIVYNGTIIGGNADNLSLNLGYTGTGSCSGYVADNGVLSGSAYSRENDPYTLTMPNSNVEISVKPGTVSVDGSAVCSGRASTLTATTVGFNNPQFTWTASSSDAGLVSQNAGEISVTPTAGGTYTYTCSVTEGSDATVISDNIELTMKQSPTGLAITGADAVCFGLTSALSASCSDNNATYSWNGGAGTGSSWTTPAITAATNVVVVATSANGCAVEENMTVTPNVPTSSERSDMGAGNGYYIWTGKSENWSLASNWMIYTSATDTYTLATAAPTASKNVAVGKYGTCVSSSSTLDINASAKAKALKIGADVTVSGSSTLTIAGSLTNNGTFEAPVVFNNTTTLYGTGSTTFSSVTINEGKTLKSSSHNITITGDCTNNGTFTAGAGEITMTGNLINNGTFKTGTGTVSLTGNWTNNGTYTAGNGVIIFAGTSSQVIGGSNATTFKNVQFSNNLTISTQPTITGTVTFSNGIITGDITLGNASTVDGASTNSYVNGKVTKIMKKNTTFTFPIGTASLYAPFEAKSSVASNVSVQYASGNEDMPDWWNHSGNFNNVGLDHASDRENWQVSASATTNLSNIKLYWNAASGNYHSFDEGTDALESCLMVAAVKKNGFYWQNLGQSAIEGDFDGAGSITAATPLAITVGAKAAGDDDYIVTFASTNKGNLLLPIDLTSFTATCDGRSALVEWTTATERNNDYFSLEHSDDAINFTEIARIAGAGNSIEPLEYSYTDYGIHGGDNYYRLVQVDYDGTRTVSEIVVANCVDAVAEDPEVMAYPNPFSGELTLVLDNFNNRAATIEVYDMLGKLIYTEKASAPQNSYETILNLSNLPSGAYTVRVSTTDFVINKNVVKN